MGCSSGCASRAAWRSLHSDEVNSDEVSIAYPPVFHADWVAEPATWNPTGPVFDDDGNPSGERLRCHVTGYTFERPDMLASAQRGPHGEVQYVSSLALTLDDSDRYVLPPEDTGPPHWAATRGRET